MVAKDGFILICTANTGGKGDSQGVYTGTEILNTAFLDRFGIKMKLEYLPQEEERRMLASRFPAENAKEIETMVRLATEIRSAFERGILAVTLSTRRLIEYFELKTVLGDGEAMRLCLLNWVDKDDEQLVRDVVSRATGRSPRSKS